MKFKLVIIILCSCCIANAQSSIGVTSIIGKSRFVSFPKPYSYLTDYKIGNAFGLSGFYVTKKDTLGVFKFELTYIKQNLHLNVDNTTSHLGFYKSQMGYKNQFIKLAVLHSINEIDKPAFRLNILVGLSAKCNISTSATGYSSKSKMQSYTDSLGNVYYYQGVEKREVNDKHTSDFRTFNFNLELGFEVKKSLSMKWDLVFQNRYNLDILSTLVVKDLSYTSVIVGTVNLGLSYKLIK